MAFVCIDPDSLALILELQLSDTERSLKGKGKEGETPDEKLAANIYKSEPEVVAQVHSDRAMCRSIVRAVQLNSDIIRQYTGLESQAVRDRQQALSWNHPVISQDSDAFVLGRFAKQHNHPGRTSDVYGLWW